MAGRAAALATELEARIVRYGDHLMTFAEFQELPDDRRIELVGGILEAHVAARLEHERLQGWFYHLLAGYVETIPGLTLQSDWLLGEERPF